MYKIVIMAKRRAGMSMDEFVDYYENHHAGLALRVMPGMTRYARNYLTAPDPRPGEVAAELPYDVITEIEFADEAAYRRAQETARGPELLAEAVADEENLFDRSTMALVPVVTYETELPPAS